ncbi:MAG TPA: ribosome-associated translation inhibitor RaiA [Pseudonocardiaceae bacterium]|jgi:ribosomal subunit interface protein|nr:ribosome-associated translation inhibitor RaiA [Pseudonocardiaceae bacterium]
MDIVVKGRNVEVPDHYRSHVEEKLTRLERYDRKLIHCDVELFHEPNRRQHKSCQRVEITTRLRGQVVRAEATAGDFYAALDCAASKLESRLRRIHDRRQVHYGRRCPTSVGQATAQMTDAPAETNGAALRAPAPTALLDQQPEPTAFGSATVPEQRWNDGLEDAAERLPGQIVREKEHEAKPMSVDAALYEMELVGHDFYLYFDVDCSQPSVVYRRKGFDYGVIRLA